MPDGLSTTVVAPTGTGAAPTGYQPGIRAVDGVPAEGHIRGVRIAVLGPLRSTRDGSCWRPGTRWCSRRSPPVPGRPCGPRPRGGAVGRAPPGRPGPRSCRAASLGCARCSAPPRSPRPGTGYRLALHRDDFDHLCFEDLLLRAGRAARDRRAGARALRQRAGARACGGETRWSGSPSGSPAGSSRNGSASGAATRRTCMPSPPSARDGTATSWASCTAWSPSSPPASGAGGCWPWRSTRRAGRRRRSAPSSAPAPPWSTSSGSTPGPQLAELEEAILRQDPALVAEGTLPGGHRRLSLPGTGRLRRR